MDSRPSSVASTSVRQRKYSTDRYLRQAELSARLEEGRPLQLRAEQIAESADEYGQQKIEDYGITSLTRADTTISPPNIHPGRRLDSYSFAEAAGVNAAFSFDAVKPWKEPTVRQQEDIERRAAVVQRAESSIIDLSNIQAQLHKPFLDAKTPALLQWIYRKFGLKPPKTPHITGGLYVTAAMNAALGLEFISKKSPDWLKRRQLHVLEYTCGKGDIFTCDSNRAFFDTAELKSHLETLSGNLPTHESGTGVHLIQIRNNEEAISYLGNAFAISSPDIHYGERGFREWMQEDRDSRRTSNMTIRWRPAFDTNRQTICMAIGIDLGSSDISIEQAGMQISQNERLLFRRRRIAIYIQRRPSCAIPNPRVTQFNSRSHNLERFAEQDCIVICEHSSDSWSELSQTPSLLTLSPVAGLPVSGSASVMASAARNIFSEIVSKWYSQIAAIHQPFADLEDLVYGKPADLTHAGQVWGWSQRLQNMLKLVLRHLKAIQTFEEDFWLLAELEGDHEWLGDVLMDLKHIADTLRGDYIEPLEHMIDLMYKSITIRDSRLSLELGTSLWRLSWITFIFLPLTFLVGFFGMNVGTFQNYPSIKWYFVALIPLALIVQIFWITFQRFGLDVQDAEHSHYAIGGMQRREIPSRKLFAPKS